MKKIKVVVVGYGNRGQVYADYVFDAPNEIEIVGIVDPNPYKLEVCKERYKLNDNQLFLNWSDFLSHHVEADIVINSTMDQTHYETALDILNAKYNMLIEKPIVPKKEQLLEIKDLAKKNNCFVFVCHVLRYTPFYLSIKKLIMDGEIGNIMTIEMNEHVCLEHFLTSYDRGKWNKEEECGSGFLLAKCCHDMDLISWLNNASKPVMVASFGNRSQFVKENKPKGATEYCHNCPHEATCQYSAQMLYVEHNTMPFLVWDKLNKSLDEVTIEERKEFLKHDVYGKCAYDCGGTIVDRQTVQISFANGSLVSFNLVGGASKPDRYIHVVGTTGEIEGKVEESQFVIRKHHNHDVGWKEEIIDVNNNIVNHAKFGGHMGGDFMIMHDLVAYLNGDRSSLSITSIDDSVNGHLIVYAAEESRKTNKFIPIE